MKIITSLVNFPENPYRDPASDRTFSEISRISLAFLSRFQAKRSNRTYTCATESRNYRILAWPIYSSTTFAVPVSRNRSNASFRVVPEFLEFAECCRTTPWVLIRLETRRKYSRGNRSAGTTPRPSSWSTRDREKLPKISLNLSEASKYSLKRGETKAKRIHRPPFLEDTRESEAHQNTTHTGYYRKTREKLSEHKTATDFRRRRRRWRTLEESVEERHVSMEERGCD